MSGLSIPVPATIRVPAGGEFKTGWEDPIRFGPGHVATRARRRRRWRGRHASRLPSSITKQLKQYRQLLRSQGVRGRRLRRLLHMRGRALLRQAMDQPAQAAMIAPSAMRPGEYRATLALEPQRFSMAGMDDWLPYEPGMPEPAGGGQGTWLSPSQVPAWDRESAAQLIASPESFGSLGQYEASRDVPISAFRPGEYGPLRLRGQTFDLRGMGQPVPISAMRPGEFGPLRLRNQQFGQYEAARDVPISALRPGEYGPLRLRDQQFGQYEASRDVPISALRPGEYQQALRLRGQQFSLSGLGQPVPISAMRPGEYRRRVQLRQQFTLPGMGNSAGQGTWLSPTQVPAWERESAASVSGPEKFNLGDHYEASRDVPISALRKGEFGTARSVGQGEQFTLSGMGQGYAFPKFQLPEICDPKSGTCIRYASPPQALLETAYTQGTFQLPAFYQHPQLGPWGVDPRQAYQYWAAQQAAIQAMPWQSPMAIFGSPGLIASTPPPLAASQVARPNAFDPYTAAFPTAGTVVERF